MSPSVQLRPADMAPAQIQTMANQLAATADRTIVADKKVDKEIFGNQYWGTDSGRACVAPQVTVLDLTNDKKTSVKFNGNVTGCGILIINSVADKKGKTQFNGNFEWNGLIIVTGEGAMDLKVAGKASIVIGLVVANTAPDSDGEQVKFKDSGNSTIQYSCSAITQAMQKSPLTINAWHELKSIGDSNFSQM